MNEVIARNIHDRVGALTERDARCILTRCVVCVVEDYGQDVIDLRSEMMALFLRPDEIERISDREDCSSMTPQFGDTEVPVPGPEVRGGTTAGGPLLASRASITAGTTGQDLENAVGADGAGPPPNTGKVSAVDREIALSSDVLVAKEPAPTKAYTALVVRYKNVKTPYLTTIIGIPGGSPEEARVTAQEVALGLPDTLARWELGETEEIEFSQPEVVEIVEEPEPDEGAMEQEFAKQRLRQLELHALRTLAVGLRRITTSLEAVTEPERDEPDAEADTKVKEALEALGRHPVVANIAGVVIDHIGALSPSTSDAARVARSLGSVLGTSIDSWPGAADGRGEPSWRGVMASFLSGLAGRDPVGQVDDVGIFEEPTRGDPPEIVAIREDLPSECRHAHRYSERACPSCGNDLTGDDAIRIETYEEGVGNRYLRSRLSADGTVEDVQSVIGRGLHSDTLCGACGLRLNESEVSCDPEGS